mgnify:FL=1
MLTDIPDLEADAIRYRLMLRNEAEAALQATIRQVQQRLQVPDGSQIQVDQATGNMTFVTTEPGQ